MINEARLTAAVRYALCLAASAIVAHADVLLSRTVFQSTGADQQYTVPGNAGYIVVKAWGAGGGAGTAISTAGGGGFVQMKIPVSAGQVATVKVGQGGLNVVGNGVPGRYPNGGFANNAGGQGGGRTELVFPGFTLIGAGGGGGAYNGGGVGGAGGYPGADGGVGYYGGGAGSWSGKGGASGGGGAAGTSSAIPLHNGTAGLFRQGGSGGVGSYVAGGGGDGYFGGGGGASTGGEPDGWMNAGGGGGGCSYAAGGTEILYINGAGATAGNSNDSDNGGNYGGGGMAGSAGNNGLMVVYAYRLQQAPSMTALGAQAYFPGQNASFTATATANPQATFSATGLPPGMAMNSAGQVSGGTPPEHPGNPYSEGTYNAVVKAANSLGEVSVGQTWIILSPETRAAANYQDYAIQPGGTMIVNCSAHADGGLAWTENKLWLPGGQAFVDLGNQYSNGAIDMSYSPAPYTIPAQTGTYTLQVRTVDQYGSWSDSWFPLDISAQLESVPYTTGFETTALTRLGTQEGWLEWQGIAYVTNDSVQGGTHALRLDVFTPQLTRVLKNFGPGGSDIFVDCWARPAAAPQGSAIDVSSVMNFGNARVGFGRTSPTQAAVYVLNGNGAGSGVWVNSGVSFAVGGSGLATDWVHLTTEINYGTGQWKLWVNGSPTSGVYGVLVSSVTAFSNVTFSGTTFSSWYLDTFSVGLTSPLIFSSPSTWPSTPVASLSDAGFVVSWVPAVSPYSPITNYQIVVQKNGATITTTNTVGTSAAITGLYPGTTYTVKVTATNGGGVTTGSSVLSVTTKSDQTPPVANGSTIQLNGTQTGTTVPIKWNAFYDLVGVTSYKIYRNGALLATQAGTSYTDTGLVIGTTYAYTVKAVDAAGNTSAAIALNVTTGFTLSVNAGTPSSAVLAPGSNIMVSANAAAAGFGFQSWSITNGSGTFANVSSASTLFTMGNANTTIKANYKDIAAPTTPGNLVVSGSVRGTSVPLVWTAATDNVAVVGYRVYRMGSLVGTSTATSYIDAGLGIGNTYNYAVTAYDAAGNESPAAVLSVSTFSYALGYGTNNRDQLTSIGSSWAGTLVSFTYNPDGQRATRVLANATTTTYGYDAVGRVNSINHQSSAPGVSIQLQTYGYDLRDRRIWTQRNNALGDTYAYQADSQLIDFKFNANNPGATPTTWASHTSYVYDAVGNRTSVAVDGTTTNYTPDHANQYAAITGMSTQYGDGRGNMTALGGWTYAYDADNRMIAATGPGVIASFAYDPIGRLVKRVINGAVEFLTYDDQDVILAVDANNALLKAVVWGARVDEIVSDYTPQRTNYFYHGDAQGNTIAVTDASGTVKESYLYDAFGTVNFFGPTGGQIGQSAIGAVYLFTGQEYMAPVGLYNYRNRFYSNLIGRFLQSDPKRLEPGDLNLYRYCSNDPFNRTDALGLESEKKGNAGESQGVDGEDAPKNTQQPNITITGVRLQQSRSIPVHTNSQDPSLSAKQPGKTLSHVEIYQKDGVATIELKQRVELRAGVNVPNATKLERDHVLDNATLFNGQFRRQAKAQLEGKTFTYERLTQEANSVSEQYLRDAAAAAEFYDGDSGYHKIYPQTSLPLASPSPAERADHLDSLK